MEKSYFLILSTLILMFFLINISPGYAWWDSNWNSKRQINFSSSSVNLFNYTILVNVSFSSGMFNNFTDIRFVNETSNTTLQFYKESYSSGNYAYFWVQVPNIPENSKTNDIHVYYSNPIATADVSDPSIFHYFEHFNGAVETVPVGWNNDGANPMTQDGLSNYSISGASWGQSHYIVSTFDPPRTFVVRMRTVSGLHIPLRFRDSSSTASGDIYEVRLNGDGTTPPTGNVDGRISFNRRTGIEWVTLNFSDTYSVGSFARLKVTWNKTETSVFNFSSNNTSTIAMNSIKLYKDFDNSVLISTQDNLFTTGGFIGFNPSGGGRDSAVDYLIITDFADPEPTYTIEPEIIQNLSCGGFIVSDTNLNSDLNCSSNGITFGANNITLDCQGHSISGPGTFPNVGILATNKQDIKIKNCFVQNFWHGIELTGTNRSQIVNNIVNNNGVFGFHLTRSSNNIFMNNTANDNNIGFDLEFSSNFNIIANNTANNRFQGFNLTASSDFNTLTSNIAQNNTIGFSLNRANFTNITSNIAVNNDVGFYLESTSNNNLTSNTASNNGDGFVLRTASRNIFTNNRALANYIFAGFNLTLFSNFNSFNSDVANNNFVGFALDTASNNSFESNNANGNSFTGFLLSTIANNNIIKSNIIKNNTFSGISINLNQLDSNNNLIYNNFFNNTVNARDRGNNSWNITKTLGINILGEPFQGGNFWSDYAGQDLTGDFLGDTSLPYNSNGNIINGGDFLPLVVINASLEGRISALEERIRELENENQILSDIVQSLNNTLNQLQNQTGSLNTTTFNNTARIGFLESLVNTLQTTVNTFENRIATLESIVQTVRNWLLLLYNNLSSSLQRRVPPPP